MPAFEQMKNQLLVNLDLDVKYFSALSVNPRVHLGPDEAHLIRIFQKIKLGVVFRPLLKSSLPNLNGFTLVVVRNSSGRWRCCSS